ncbi:MAG: methylenetetrahydrofolate--tRNA-(uracil(54)-C(5))-methyltransferase (FADH(2)-oxidizing) TrmFO [Deltaproteobacteria bacterium]|nr:methylenetetrahydrofolate--tRNA-(uracil(54)-C(5))-methyltransferase (FADH(2)-oxidizing) TrmFO [Deltaproteobacteria bacterium]
MNKESVTIIGAGLAGCEASWQLLRRGFSVDLKEMKPACFSPAHTSPHLAELVCSNSLRSADIGSAVGLLKQEMRELHSLIMMAADATAVPAGKALAVDRKLFSRFIEDRLFSQPGFSIIRGECREIPRDGSVVIVAAGPLASDALAHAISEMTGADSLYFYDAISPIVLAESVDRNIAFQASRYDEEQPGDYLNCPLSTTDYERFLSSLLKGREVPLRDFEDRRCFEGCLPIEVMARRGPETLRFGPMKPVGLNDPRTGRRPHAVLQLRRENREGTLFNMVGFQTKLAWPEQKRIFRMIPGLEKAEFMRFGSIHRNTFIDSPRLLTDNFMLANGPGLFFAGQITGVEGYVESAASGLLVGISAGRYLSGVPWHSAPPETSLGSLIRHIKGEAGGNFQPMNINFGLFPPLEKKVPRNRRGAAYADRALQALHEWMEKYSVIPEP